MEMKVRITEGEFVVEERHQNSGGTKKSKILIPECHHSRATMDAPIVNSKMPRKRCIRCFQIYSQRHDSGHELFYRW